MTFDPSTTSPTPHPSLATSNQILSDLTNDHTFYSVSDKLNHAKKQKMFSLALRCFDLNSGVSNHVLDSYEDFNRMMENTKDCWYLVQIELDLLIYLHSQQMYCTHVNFEQFYSVYKLLIKEHEKILPAKCSTDLAHNITEKKVRSAYL